MQHGSSSLGQLELFCLFVVFFFFELLRNQSGCHHALRCGEGGSCSAPLCPQPQARPWVPKTCCSPWVPTWHRVASCSCHLPFALGFCFLVLVFFLICDLKSCLASWCANHPPSSLGTPRCHRHLASRPGPWSPASSPQVWPRRCCGTEPTKPLCDRPETPQPGWDERGASCRPRWGGSPSPGQGGRRLTIFSSFPFLFACPSPAGTLSRGVCSTRNGRYCLYWYLACDT